MELVAEKLRGKSRRRYMRLLQPGRTDFVENLIYPYMESLQASQRASRPNIQALFSPLNNFPIRFLTFEVLQIEIHCGI